MRREFTIGVCFLIAVIAIGAYFGEAKAGTYASCGGSLSTSCAGAVSCAGSLEATPRKRPVASFFETVKANREARAVKRASASCSGSLATPKLLIIVAE